MPKHPLKQVGESRKKEESKDFRSNLHAKLVDEARQIEVAKGQKSDEKTGGWNWKIWLPSMSVALLVIIVVSPVVDTFKPVTQESMKMESDIEWQELTMDTVSEPSEDLVAVENMSTISSANNDLNVSNLDEAPQEITEYMATGDALSDEADEEDYEEEDADEAQSIEEFVEFSFSFTNNLEEATQFIVFIDGEEVHLTGVIEQGEQESVYLEIPFDLVQIEVRATNGSGTYTDAIKTWEVESLSLVLNEEGLN